MTTTIETFIEDFTARYAALHRQSTQATWQAHTTGEEAAFAESARLTKAMRTLFADRDAFEQLTTWQDGSPPADPLVRRQLKLLYLGHLAGQNDPDMIEQLTETEREISQTFINFRGELDGQRLSDNEIETILRTSADSREVRNAWMAGKQVGAQVADQVREVVRLRNESAHRLGFPNHYALSLVASELDEDWLFALLDDLAARSEELFREMKAEMDAPVGRALRHLDCCPAPVALRRPLLSAPASPG